MAIKSDIGWTNSSWNPVTGCDKVSAGCDNCYAESFSERFRGVKGHHFKNGFDLQLRPERLLLPFDWKKPRKIFVNSMSDLFHKGVPDEYVAMAFWTMESNPRHTFQVLTKRSSLLRDFVNKRFPDSAKPAPDHILLGVSIENSDNLVRLRHLKETNAAKKFISFEPLLGSVGTIDLAGIDWVIMGGESGHGFRKVDISWLREIRDQCTEQKVALFFKQWGGRTSKIGGNELDGKHWLNHPEHDLIAMAV